MFPYPGRRSGSSRFLVVLSAILLTSTVWWVISQRAAPPGSPSATSGASTPTFAPAGLVEVTMFSSDTKEDWLNAVVADFNARQVRISTGQAITVQVKHGNSGDSKDAILAGTLAPTVWSPGDQSWVKALNEEWQLDHPGEVIIPDDCQATVYAPVGFAMWRPMAEAMGWPETPIGWREIVELMADPEGWGRYGHEEWGQFKFGHTDPRSSNSGLLLLTALAYATWDIRAGLTVDMVKSSAYIEAMRTVEAHTYHYGNKSRDNVVRMLQLGPDFLHATNTSEAETLRANQGVYGEGQFELAFVFAADGTFWAEQPYCVLKAPWVTPEQAEAAQIFEAYLHEQPQQVLAVSNYLRPTSSNIPVGEPFSLANGTDPNKSTVTAPNLEDPAPEVLAAVQDTFIQTRRQSTVVLVVDTSNSMNTPSDKIKNAAEAAAQFVASMGTNDEVYVYLFGDRVVQLQPSGRVGNVSEDLAGKLRFLIAGGQTYLNDAICEAARQIKTLQSEAEAGKSPPLYGIVVLSDGRDTASQHTANDVLNVCLPAREEATGVRVFTVAYGEDADTTFLTRLANSSNGKFFEANPDNVAEILLEILYQ